MVPKNHNTHYHLSTSRYVWFSFVFTPAAPTDIFSVVSKKIRGLFVKSPNGKVDQFHMNFPLLLHVRFFLFCFHFFHFYLSAMPTLFLWQMLYMSKRKKQMPTHLWKNPMAYVFVVLPLDPSAKGAPPCWRHGEVGVWGHSLQEVYVQCCRYGCKLACNPCWRNRHGM